MAKQNISTSLLCLTQSQVQQFKELGYVKNLPIFGKNEISKIQKKFKELTNRLPDQADINWVNMWHKCSPWYYQLCCHPVILDHVQDLLGPNLFLWGSRFFVKYPLDGTEVPWHQDYQYWPMSPRKSVTLWLAVYDVDADNAAMQVIRGSHLQNEFAHKACDNPSYLLAQEANISSCKPDDIVTMDLKAGEISMHDPGLLHSSGPNNSQRIRCGLVMIFCPTEVRFDLSVWPKFEAYYVRGTDKYRHNPQGKIPSCEGYPIGKEQHSSEFV